MKRIAPYLFSVLFSFFAVSAHCQNISVTANIKKGKFLFNGINISNEWKSAPLISKLGSSYRLTDKYNKVYTFDNLGIVVFESKKDEVGTGNISEIQFHYKVTEDNNVVPQGTFSGKLQIEGLKASINVSYTTVKAKLKNYKISDSYMEHSYRLSYGGIYFYFRFNDTDTELYKVSIGKDNR